MPRRRIDAKILGKKKAGCQEKGLKKMKLC